MLLPSPTPGRIRLGLSWIEGQQPNIKMTDDMAAIVQKRERAVEFRFDSPGLLSPAKDAPPRYQVQRLVEYSDFSDWAVISRRFAPLYAMAAKFSADSPLKREASRIAAASASPFDRAAAALRLVQQDVHTTSALKMAGILLQRRLKIPGSADLVIARARPYCCWGCSLNWASRPSQSWSAMPEPMMASTSACQLRACSITCWYGVRIGDAVYYLE